MPEIFLLRHGQSEANVGQIDKYDSPLTDVGKEQAAAVRGHFDLVLCSPLRRTKETLQHSNVTYDQLETLENAREKVYHNSDAYPHEEVKQEPVPDFVERMLKLKKDLASYMEPGKKVLIVGHWWVFKVLTSSKSNIEEMLNGKCSEGDGQDLDNCQLTKVDLQLE